MEGQEGAMESQSLQHHHHAHHHSYNNQQYSQGQGDYQYLPGQHWLAGPSVINHEQSYHNNNGSSMGGFGGQLSQFSSYNQTMGGLMSGGCSTIHHTGPQQHQQQISGAGGGSLCPLPALPMPYSVTQGSSNSRNNNSIPGVGPPMPYLNSCTNYPYHHGHGTSGFSSHICHHHGQFGGTSTTITASATATATNPVPAPSRMPWSTSSDMLAYPGGLEIVWREVPEACHKLITMQDVPDTARMRGYFTVFELLNLKRNLVGRLNSIEAERPQIIAREEGVGGAVKEAMNILDDTQSQNSTVLQDVSNCKGRTKNLTVEKDQEPIQGNDEVTEVLPSTVSSPSIRSSDVDTSITTTAIQSNPSTAKYAFVPSTSTNSIQQIDKPMSQYVSPPPAYRTATLVFKLLQIGNHHIRSFSEVNPNRFRVLFNTQRITYECHLTLVKPRDSIHGNVRKLLTVDIGFDQITVLRFGCNKLFMRVEGSPLLSISYYPAEMDNTCPPMTEQDHQLLEQIDKGQLKLSPCHQIYFINERLVHLLEAQFKQHPRFRNIIQHSSEPSLYQMGGPTIKC